MEIPSYEIKKDGLGQVFLSLFVGSTVGAEVMTLLHYYMGPNGWTWETVIFSPFVGLIYLMFMLPISLAIGLPAYFRLANTKLLNGISVTTIGTLTGGAAGMFIGGSKIETIAFMAFGGFVSSWVCWIVYKLFSVPNGAR